MIQEEICTYEVCKLAKENGFSIECDLFYNRNEELCDDRNYDSFDNEILCFAPTKSLLQRWLREEWGYYVYPFFDNEKLKWTYVVREKTGDMWIPLIGETPYYDCFDESMEDALKFVLENLVKV